MPQDSHVYTLTSVNSGRNAEVHGSSQAQGSAVTQADATGAPNQLWQAVSDGSGHVSLAALHSGQCLDVPGSAGTAGTALDQWGCSGHANQLWQVTRSGTAGGYALRSVSSGLCLDTAAPATANGSALVQQPCTGLAGQQWLLRERPRVAAWSPSQGSGGPAFTNQTVRMVVRSSVAGSGLRIRVSDERSGAALAVGAVDVAVRGSGGAAVPGTHHTALFARSGTVTVAAGAAVQSDVIGMTVTQGEDLLVSIYLPGSTGPSTWHSNAIATSYLSTAGNHSGEDAATAYPTTTTSWYYLSGLDVVSPTATGTVVAFGDSITDGYNSTVGADQRWPDLLADRLAAEPGGQRLAAADDGLSGNRVLTDSPYSDQGTAALTRFGQDALGQPGVKDVLLLEGINDIHAMVNANGSPLTAQDLINGYQTLIARAHAAGVRMIGGTITPQASLTADQQALRTAVNTWIRTGGAFDGVVDFDAVMKDPANPAALNPGYDSGDGLHPNSAGMQAMAAAVNLAFLS
ncbi:RICIN domain-containing protein [Streptacidiphilus sp. PAMC 29251]